MKIITTLIIIYIISLLLILSFVYTANKKETKGKRDSNWVVLFVSVLLALAPTVALGLILFAILGSVNLVDSVFNLGVDISQLILLAIAVLIYFFTVDTVVELFVKTIVGENKIYSVIVLLSRIFFIYIIGLLIGFTSLTSFILATGVALITLFVETLYYYRSKDQ